MKKIKVLESFAGYGSQSISLRDMGVNHEVIGISEIEPDAIIAYGSIRFNLDEIHTEKTHEEMKKELMDKNVGWDFQKNKSRIPRMKKDKLEMLYKFDKESNNFGDISLINPNNLPNFDYFTMSFPCFVKGTLVLTSNGYKNIEDITSHDYVLTHNNRYKKVVKPMINKADHIYKLSTMCSEDLLVTEERPFYVRKKYYEFNDEIRYDNGAMKRLRKFSEPSWVKAKDLTKDYYVGCAINTKSELPNWQGIEYNGAWGHKVKANNLVELFSNDDFWWIIGRFMGDGWTREYKGTQNEKFNRHDERVVICCAKDELNEITDVLDKLPFNYNIAEERTVYKIHIINKEFTRYLYQFGKGAKNKRLTGDILNLPKHLLKEFLDGYMSADGCVSQGLNKATSVSKELIYGIGQCVAKVHNKPFSIYKTKRRKTCVIEGRTVNQNTTYQITWKNDTKKQDKAFYEDGYIWCPINSVEKLEYDGLVYNMEVEDDNSYVVQNIIVHNCTDISVSGKQEGIIKGETRSGLLYECEKIIEIKKPKYILMENVKNLVGKKFKEDFDKWCKYLESLGYTNYWKVLNAKDFGVAQNRERVFMWSVLGEHKPYEFPKGFKLEKRLKDFLEESVEEKYYLSQEIQDRFKQTKIDDGANNIIGTTAPEFRTIGQRDLVYSQESTMGTLVATDYKQPKQIIEYADRLGGCFDEEKTKHQAGSVWNKGGLCPTLDTMQGGYRMPLVTEDIKIEKVGNLECKGWHEIETRVHSTEGLAPTVETRNRAKYLENPQIIDDTQGFDGIRYYDEYCPTLRANRSGLKTDYNFRIRKLTPKECLRLMGLSDEDINKIQSTGLSDSSLYKLAGNSIVKQCLDYLHINMFINE